MAEGQGRSSNQGVKLLYIRDYLHKYTNKEHPKSAKEISEYLASKGIKADRKTIYNDILRLQVDFQEPIEYSPKKWGYYITKPQFDTYELRMLLDSIQTSRNLTEDESHAMVNKVLELANTYDKEHLAKQLQQRKKSRKAENSSSQNAEVISKAIAANKKISFRYFRYVKERENKHKEYFNFDDSSDINIVSPKALEWRNGKYVLTIFTNSRYARAYRLEFMEDVKILSQDREHLHPECVKHSTAVSSELLLKREGYTFDAHKEYAVTILIPEVLIEEVFRYWGHDTPIIPYDTYNVIFTVHTTLSDSFYLWLLDLGTRAKILAPVEAIGELFYFFNQIGNMYGYGSPDFLKNIPTTYDEMRAQKHGFKRQMRYMKHKK